MLTNAGVLFLTNSIPFCNKDTNDPLYSLSSKASITPDALSSPHQRLVLRGSNTSFDSLSTRYSFDALAFTKLRSVYRMRTGTELMDSDFVSFELVDENNMLTNAGVLLADESPMRT